MSAKTKQNTATKWFSSFVVENESEILIHKTILKIACLIKAEREKQKLSQKYIAEKTGLTESTISRLEKDKNTSD